MTSGMEIMIMVALLVFILTGLISIGLTIWYMKSFMPMIKIMTKQWTKMYGEMEEEEVELTRVK